MRDFLPDQVYKSIGQTQEVIEFLMSNYEDDLSEIAYPYVLTIVLKDTNELIGHVGLSKIAEGIEVGYSIGESYQKNGYATEAVGAFTDWAKEHLKLDKIYAIVKSHNTSSCKSLVKTGFKFLNMKTGKALERYILKNCTTNNGYLLMGALILCNPL